MKGEGFRADAPSAISNYPGVQRTPQVAQQTYLARWAFPRGSAAHTLHTGSPALQVLLSNLLLPSC
jgi:hypothetical protein